MPSEQREPQEATAPTSPAAVAEVLQRLRSSVRQRTAELAALPAADAQRAKLAELRAREFVREPVPVSPRPLLGRPLVLLRKLAFHLGLKWFTRPVLEQQNAYNQAASAMIEGLAVALEDAQRRLTAAETRIQALESQGTDGERPGAGG